MVIINSEKLGEEEMTKTYVCEICHRRIFRAHGSGTLKKCAKCCRKGRVRR
jgi:ribosomal protein L37AE/L43A